MQTPYRWGQASVMFAAMLISGGCMHLPQNINIGETAEQPPPDKGLLVGSITQTSDGNPSPFHSIVDFTFGPADGSDTPGSGTFRLTSGVETIHFPLPESWLADRGLEDVNGRLFATAVAPGTYALLGFRIANSMYEYHKIANPITFEVASGEALYLGNFEAAFCVRHVYANQYSVAGIRLSVKDQSGRDIPSLRNKVTALRNVEFEKRLLNTAALERQTVNLSRWCDCDRDCISDL